MSASLNSEAGLGVGVQSTSAHQNPASEQESGGGKKGRSSRMCKQTKTYSLTTRQQELAPRYRKTKARKGKGVKASGSEGTKSTWFRVLVEGEESSVFFLLPLPNRKVSNFRIALSLRTQTIRMRRAHTHLHTPSRRANPTSLLSRQ